MGEKRWFRLDDRELLSAEPVQPDRRLAPDDAATDDRDAVGYLAEVGGVPRGPRSGLAQAGDRRYRGRGTGRDYDGLPGMEPAHGGLRRRDLDRLLAGQPAGASDHVDPVRPLNLLGVVVIVDKAVAPAQCEHWTSSSSDSTITAVRRPSLDRVLRRVLAGAGPPPITTTSQASPSSLACVDMQAPNRNGGGLAPAQQSDSGRGAWGIGDGIQGLRAWVPDTDSRSTLTYPHPGV